MSVNMLRLAFEAQTERTADKLVLLKLADHANDDAECWPSQAHIERHTGLSKRTIIRSINRLEKSGFLTKKPTVRKDGTKGRNRYILHLDPCVTMAHGGQSAMCHRDTQPCVTVTPLTNHQLEPSIKKELPGGSSKEKSPSTKTKIQKPDDVDDQVWSDYLEFRRKKKAPLTQTAWNRIDKELARGVEKGYTRDDMLAEAMTGWQGFKLEWYEKRIGTLADTADGLPTDVLALYRDMLTPPLRDVIGVDAQRAKEINTLAQGELKTIDDWETFFKVVRDSPILTGRKPWFASGEARPVDLDFLLKHAVKIMEGKYDG